MQWTQYDLFIVYSLSSFCRLGIVPSKDMFLYPDQCLHRNRPDWVKSHQTLMSKRHARIPITEAFRVSGEKWSRWSLEMCSVFRFRSGVRQIHTTLLTPSVTGEITKLQYRISYCTASFVYRTSRGTPVPLRFTRVQFAPPVGRGTAQFEF